MTKTIKEILSREITYLDYLSAGHDPQEIIDAKKAAESTIADVLKEIEAMMKGVIGNNTLGVVRTGGVMDWKKENTQNSMRNDQRLRLHEALYGKDKR